MPDNNIANLIKAQKTFVDSINILKNFDNRDLVETYEKARQLSAVLGNEQDKYTAQIKQKMVPEALQALRDADLIDENNRIKPGREQDYYDKIYIQYYEKVMCDCAIQTLDGIRQLEKFAGKTGKVAETVSEMATKIFRKEKDPLDGEKEETVTQILFSKGQEKIFEAYQAAKSADEKAQELGKFAQETIEANPDLLDLDEQYINFAKDTMRNVLMVVYDAFIEADKQIRPMGPPIQEMRDMTSPEVQQQTQKVHSAFLVETANLWGAINATIQVDRYKKAYAAMEKIKENRGIFGKLMNIAPKPAKSLWLQHLENKSKRIEMNFERNHKGKEAMVDAEMQFMKFQADKKNTYEQVGQKFAEILSDMNCFRCGKSSVLPGWFSCLHMSNETKIEGYALLMSGMYVTKDGVQYDPERNLKEYEAIKKALLPLKNRRDFDKIFKSHLEKLEKKHEQCIKDLTKQRQELKLPPLSTKHYNNALLDNSKEEVHVFQYAVKSYEEWKSDQCDVEKEFKDKDAIIVCKGDTITGLFKDETRIVGTLLDETGKAKDMDTRTNALNHQFNDGKAKTDEKMQDMIVGLKTNDLFDRTGDQARESVLSDIIEKMLTYGFEAKRDEDQSVIFTDPLNHQSFAISKCTPLHRDEMPVSIQTYVTSLKETFLHSLLTEIDKEMRPYIEKDVMKADFSQERFVKDDYMAGLDSYRQAVRTIRNADMETMLNINTRLSVIQSAKSTLDHEHLTMEARQNHMNRMQDIKDTMKEDALLAYCKTISDTFHRENNEIIGTVDGYTIKITQEENGQYNISGRGDGMAKVDECLGRYEEDMRTQTDDYTMEQDDLEKE